MQKSSVKFSNLKTGITVFVGILIFFTFFIVIGSGENYFDKTYEIKTIVKNVDGLSEGAMVTLGGLKIGRVNRLRFYLQNNANAIEILMKIKREYQPRITNQSEATIKTIGMLGDKYVDISIGAPGQACLNEGDYILIKKKLNLDNISDELNPVLDDLNKVMSNLKTTTDNLTKNKSVLSRLLVDEKLGADIQKTVTNLGTFSSRINNQNGTLSKLAYSSELYESIKKSSNDIAALTYSIKNGNGTIGRMVTNDSLYRSMNGIVGKLDKLITQANSDTTVAGALLNDKQLLFKVNTVVTKMDTLVTDFKTNPKRYIDFSVF